MTVLMAPAPCACGAAMRVRRSEWREGVVYWVTCLRCTTDNRAHSEPVTVPASAQQALRDTDSKRNV